MMRRFISSWFPLLVICGTFFVTLSFAEPRFQANEKVVRLSSLDWPPYTGKALPAGGSNVELARKAFELKGYRLEVSFFPWRRALMLAEQGKEYDGVLPGYFAEARQEAFLFSDAFKESSLVLVQRKSTPIVWQSVRDLQKYRLGVVSGYVNTAELDALIAEGVVKVSSAIDDLTNLLKLALGRVDAAVVDRAVFEYLAHHDQRLAPFSKDLEVHPTELALQKLHLCFHRSERGETLRKAFNEGLKLLNKMSQQ